jgi:endoglucanase
MRPLPIVALLALGLLATPAMAAHGCSWPAWESFRTHFVDESGRVVDPSTPRRMATSEGQAYALFFALAARDRATFDRLLHWTEANLAAGDLGARLPAWAWGRRDDDSWGVLDDNAAADADLWLAYTLGEAGRLWREERYTALAAQLAARIAREETAELPDLGLTLLPGPRGFHWAPDRWRLNPSYLPLPLMERMAVLHGEPWRALAKSSREVIIRSAKGGFVPDWIAFEQGTLRPDAGKGSLGSYDAIRVYLWAGMMPEGEARAALVAAFAPMAHETARAGAPPLEVETRSGATRGIGPVGFSAALLPFLDAAGERGAAAQQRRRIDAEPAAALAGRYYDSALIAFGTGWSEGRFRFAVDGALLPGDCR